ncbi:MAG: helix-turn-helix domain-containing protein [Spirosomataceae bacterium]
MPQIILVGMEVSDFLEELRVITQEQRPLISSAEPTTGKRYLTAKEAAAFLGIKLQTLYQNIEKLPSIKKHGKLFFVESELIAYMEGGREL